MVWLQWQTKQWMSCQEPGSYRLRRAVFALVLLPVMLVAGVRWRAAHLEPTCLTFAAPDSGSRWRSDGNALTSLLTQLVEQALQTNADIA